MLSPWKESAWPSAPTNVTHTKHAGASHSGAQTRPALEIQLQPSLSCHTDPACWSPRVFEDKFGDKFGEQFGDSLNFVINLVTILMTYFVSHQICHNFW